MKNTPELKGLAADLRRLLYLNQITTFTIDAIMSNSICQPIIKDIIKKQINAMNYVKMEIKRRDSANTCNQYRTNWIAIECTTLQYT